MFPLSASLPSLFPLLTFMLCFHCRPLHVHAMDVLHRLKVHRRSSTRGPTTGRRGSGGRSGVSTTARAGAAPRKLKRSEPVCSAATPEGRGGNVWRPKCNTTVGKHNCTTACRFRFAVTELLWSIVVLCTYFPVEYVGWWCQVSCTRCPGVIRNIPFYEVCPLVMTT